VTVETETLMMEILSRIQADVSTIKTDVREMKTRVGLIEQRMTLIESHITDISLRMDRRDDVIERILSRLELSEKPVS
jgi:predicted  nucleic acid-binding Zn-ribbon protein